MLDEIVVKRYAQAFMDFARETCGIEKALEDFKNLKTIIRQNPDFQEILHSPQIPQSEKNIFILKVLAEDFSVEFVHFLELLLEKRRIDKLADIAEYARIHYAHAGVTDAILRTSFPLDLELIEQLKHKLEEKFNKKLRLYIDLDGNLLGGVQVVMGNTVLDGTVRGSLQDLKEELKTVRV